MSVLTRGGAGDRRSASSDRATLRAMPTFEYQELLPVGHHDDTPFQRLTADHVSTFEARGKTFLEVAARRR